LPTATQFPALVQVTEERSADCIAAGEVSWLAGTVKVVGVGQNGTVAADALAAQSAVIASVSTAISAGHR
jgi:hypothetical protein